MRGNGDTDKRHRIRHAKSVTPPPPQIFENRARYRLLGAESIGRLLIVGLDATNVPRLARVHELHEIQQRLPELETQGGQPTRVVVLKKKRKKREGRRRRREKAYGWTLALY